MLKVTARLAGLGAGACLGDREAVCDALNRKEVYDVLCSKESLKRHGWRARRRRLAAAFPGALRAAPPMSGETPNDETTTQR